MLRRVKVSDALLRGLALLFLMLSLLVGGIYLIIFIDPYVPINPFPPPSSRPTAKPTPEGPVAVITFPPTWTPTPTFTPSPTPTPTSTPTPTPTFTPTPTPTFTPTPTPRPRPPTPTPTPTPPPPYEPINWGVRRNCAWRGVHGTIWGAHGLPLAGIYVKIWDEAGHSVMAGPTDYDGIYSIYIPYSALSDGRWWLQVIENGQPASAPWGVYVGGGCLNGVHEVQADWRRRF
jgi:hypothetical protein